MSAMSNTMAYTETKSGTFHSVTFRSVGPTERTMDERRPVSWDDAMSSADDDALSFGGLSGLLLLLFEDRYLCCCILYR
jgi:hypothetical protein